jgi:phage FluMu protein Com
MSKVLKLRGLATALLAAAAIALVAVLLEFAHPVWVPVLALAAALVMYRNTCPKCRSNLAFRTLLQRRTEDGIRLRCPHCGCYLTRASGGR